MSSWSSLIGHLLGCWILIDCFMPACCVLENAKDAGYYGSTCGVNSDCQIGLNFICVANTCECDYSFLYNNGKCKKVCQGSNEGLVRHGDSSLHYTLYRNRYTNCTYVATNLEITNLEGNYDLGFLKDIEDIGGYLLVVNVFSNYLNLTNLRIIRGRDQFPFRNNTYSVYIALNHNIRNDSQGLLELQFKNLREIVRGGVYFLNNNLACFTETIRWDDINPTSVPPIHMGFDTLNYRRPCPRCPANCLNPHTGHFHCWGSTPDMCQQLNYVKEVCSQSCDGRCFGTNQKDCCHSECAAGCTGGLRTDCLACKNFYNDGECVPYCPPMRAYKPKEMKWFDDPKGRYTFSSYCVHDCPSYLVKDSDACVLKCPEGKYPNKQTSVCEPCNGPCPKKCPGMNQSEFLTGENIQGFKGCTIVDGNLKIFKVSFEGDKRARTTGISVEDLQMLKDIKEINGYLDIQEAPAIVTDLSFLSNLEIIWGRYLASSGYALSIVKNELQYLSLTSLRQISNGGVIIALNSAMCYTQNLDMSPIFTNRTEQTLRVGKNQNQSECDAKGLKCDSECSEHGCWGPGPDKCLLCKNVRVTLKNTCLASCQDMPMLYEAQNNTCKKCDKQCALGCFGPGPDQCFECKQVKVLGQNNTFQCMSECPRPQEPPYLCPDENRICRQCDLSGEEGNYCQCDPEMNMLQKRKLRLEIEYLELKVNKLKLKLKKLKREICVENKS